MFLLWIAAAGSAHAGASAGHRGQPSTANFESADSEVRPIFERWRGPRGARFDSKLPVTSESEHSKFAATKPQWHVESVPRKAAHPSERVFTHLTARWGGENLLGESRWFVTSHGMPRKSVYERTKSTSSKTGVVVTRENLPKLVAKFVGTLWLLLILLPSLISAADLQRFGRTERHMGADFTVKLYAADEKAADDAFMAAFDLIAQYDKMMSDYDADSELSQLGQKSPTAGFVKVSQPLYDVLKAARDVSQATDGSFDVTVGPLTKLWRRARRQKELPTDEERETALKSVGWQSMKLDENQQAVSLSKPNMRLDLGGIAPGYAADHALKKLRELGIKSALVDASGDVALGDAPPGEKGWKIGIAPLKADGPPDRFLTLANCAVTTSGDAFRGVEIGGVRYSHIVDPKTGVGLKHRSSVTVIAPNCTIGDALATAVSVLGPEKGLEALKRFPGTQARFVTQDEQGQVHEVESEGFPR